MATMENHLVDEGKINATLLIQRQILIKQMESLSEFNTKIDISQELLPTVPDLLKRRNMTDRSRLVDNEEIALMDILDADGMISNETRLSTFMVFMTRITKVSLLKIFLNKR